jgi:hypothetical protein
LARERHPHDKGEVCKEVLHLPDMVPLRKDYAKVMHPDLDVDHMDPQDPRWPRYLEPGVYDKDGHRLGGLDYRPAGGRPKPRLFIEFAGVTFVWGVFDRPLRGGEEGRMLFKNVPGTGPITPFFGEWDPAADVPRVGDALFLLIASQRGRGEAQVVGRNTSQADLPAAAGFIVSQTVGMPEEEDGAGRTPPARRQAREEGHEDEDEDEDEGGPERSPVRRQSGRAEDYEEEEDEDADEDEDEDEDDDEDE